MLTPPEIAQNFVNVGISKSKTNLLKLFFLGCFAGMFISFAGAGATIASATITNHSAARLLSSAVFPCGLVLVILCGSELFTGDCLMVMSVLEKKVKFSVLVRTLIIVFLGNLIGAFFVDFLFVACHLPDLFDGVLSKSIVSTAVAKCNLNFLEAFVKGILCNMLVCLAVWAAAASKDVAGKIIALYLPILVFVLAGFEHSVANMFYIPVALLISLVHNIDPEGLTWSGFLITNLVPVTLGNLVGGYIIGIGYWFIYLKCDKIKCFNK